MPALRLSSVLRAWLSTVSTCLSTGANTGFPKKWMLDQLHVRGDRVCASSSFKTSSGQEWTLLTASDKDKQAMSLLGSVGTSNMGEAMQRTYSVLKADGTFEVMKFVLVQWAIRSIYRRNFNAIDMHNSKRQGATCFEDTWKTHRWWIREFQMLIGMSEINSFLL
jgi:hypothetical protein